MKVRISKFKGYLYPIWKRAYWLTDVDAIPESVMHVMQEGNPEDWELSIVEVEMFWPEDLGKLKEIYERTKQEIEWLDERDRNLEKWIKLGGNISIE